MYSLNARILTRAAVVALVTVCFADLLFAGPTEDARIAGYAAAVLELELNVPSPTVQVSDGVITLRSEELAGKEKEKVIEALSRIKGVTAVQITEKDSAPPPSVGATLFPSSHLFKHLEADPRWPHFSVAYQYYFRDPDFDHVGSVSLGETLALLQGDFPLGGQWQLGIQGAVFAIFDMASDSHDLLNADYFVGLPLTYRYDSFSMLARVFHQSSHLGDELVLRDTISHINLSYESVDVKVSYDFFKSAARVYCGLGYLFDQDPHDLKPLTTQVGVELESPQTFLGGLVRPVAAVDVQNRENTDWRTAISARAGAQIESPKLGRLSLQLLLEYYNGQSPHGQFFVENIQYLGIGIHFFYR